MKKTSGKFPILSCAMQVLLAVITLHLPSVGNCDSGNGGFRGLFEFKDKDMKEVATKVAELPEQYPMNVKGLDFSRDGNQLAVISTEESINIWDWQNGRNQLAVISTEESINIWDWQNGRIAHTVKRASGASDGQTTQAETGTDLFLSYTQLLQTSPYRE